jgi:hypothetical protein
MIVPIKKTENRHGDLKMGKYVHFNFDDKDGSRKLKENSNYLSGLPVISCWDNSIKQLKYASHPINTEDKINIGGDIHGMQAAPEIAQSNHKVYLPGRTGITPGLVTTFDINFPIIICDACFHTPKKAETGQQHIPGLQNHSDLITSGLGG